MIAGRHIRWNWQEWIDHSVTNQVRTVCGIRSTNRLCGIPGITEQPVLVKANATSKRMHAGWCIYCLIKIRPVILQWDKDYSEHCTPDILARYTALIDAMTEQLECFSKDGLISLSLFIQAIDPSPARGTEGFVSDTTSKYYRGDKNPLYRIWTGMIYRCYNPYNSSYDNYGGRGIKVADRWHKFENFVDDMYPRPDGKSLDRINKDGDYEPGNVRWVDAKTRAGNRRTKTG